MKRTGKKTTDAGKKTTTGKQGKPVRVQPVGSTKERAAAALDYAARRVPAWQVSAVAVLTRLEEVEREAVTGSTAIADAIKATLAQVPPEVKRAVELHRAKAKTGANNGT